MSWMQRLYETYEACAGNKNIPDSDALFPVSHSSQQAQIEIVIDSSGNFKSAKVLSDKSEQKTLIQCTEESSGRAGKKPKCHPLCDKLQYIAGDFVEYGGKVTSGFVNNPSEPFENYCELLKAWCNSQFSHEMACAILSYVNKKRVISDLLSIGILQIDNRVLKVKNILLEWRDDKKNIPDIFKSLPPGQNPMDSFVRFRVLSNDKLESGTWESKSLIQSWIDFYASNQVKKGMCLIKGHEDFLAEQHPSKIRHDADKAKLISSNDTSGYTFKGRFTDSEQVANTSFEVTQKAHNALRWLVRRKQAFKNGDQVFVTWAVRGTDIPDPFINSLDFLGVQENIQTVDDLGIGDVGQSFAFRINKKIAGYKASLSDTDNIIIMGLDSATPGRMAIPYYRELTGSEFLNRIENWHKNFAWDQNFGKDLRFVGVPSPKDIAWSAYGKKTEGKGGKKLVGATVERILPCIIDGAKFPNDLIISCIHRVSNRIAMERWEWEKCLGIACSLYRGSNKEKEYSMELEVERKTRDYLYGCLLAVGEKIESTALSFAKENRDTAAARYMQRFSDRPFSTWKLIEGSLVPYMSRINTKMPGLLAGYKELLDEIHSSFAVNDYTEDKPLSGEYLLGYHCQRKWLWEHKRENGKWVKKLQTDTDSSDTDYQE
mgnify:CR=1 FL=1